MAKPIRIPVASDTREFATGIKKGVIQPLEDLEETLDDVAKAGDEATDDLVKGFDRAADEVSDFKKEQSELGKAISRTSREAGDDFGKNIKRGTDKGSDGLKDFKSEAAGTARESAASFDGSAESIGDSFQEVAANAFSGFGPAGAIAGLALAAGFGVFRAAMEKDAEAIEERTSDMFQDMLESQSSFLSESYLTDAVAALFGDPEKMKEIAKAAKIAGLEIEDVAAAYAGDADAIKLVDKALDDAADAQLALSKAQKDFNSETIIAARKSQDALAGVDESTASAAKRASAYSDTVGKYGDKWKAADKAAQGTAASVNKVGNKDVTVKVKGDTKQLQADIARATTKQTLKLVIDAVDRAGRAIK